MTHSGPYKAHPLQYQTPGLLVSPQISAMSHTHLRAPYLSFIDITPANTAMPRQRVAQVPVRGMLMLVALRDRQAAPCIVKGTPAPSCDGAIGR